MPTLSFSCPKCDKLHERVKPEMVGHKVRCQCGFVFRLGSKSDKQEWFAAELKRKKEQKNRKQAEASSVSRPVPNELESLFDLPPKDESLDSAGPSAVPFSNDVRDANPIVSNRGLADVPAAKEILDGVPIPAKPDRVRNPVNVHPVPDQPAYQPDPFAMDDLSSIPAGYVTEPDLFAAARSTQHLSAAPPLEIGRGVKPQRTRKKTRGKSQNSVGGPVSSLVLSLIGIPGLLFAMIVFGAVAYGAYSTSTSVPGGMPRGFGQAGISNSNSVTGSPTVQMILSIGMLLLYGALTLSVIATAVVAIMELSSRRFIGWASKVSAIIASAVLVCLFLMFCSSIVNMFLAVNEIEKTSGLSVDKSYLGQRVFWLVLTFCLFALIPVAVMITGFARVWKR